MCHTLSNVYSLARRCVTFISFVVSILLNHWSIFHALKFLKIMTSILFSFYRLVEEVGEISETVESLQAKLRMAENSLQELLRTKASLEQDLSIKNNSLFIDREKCLGMRKTFPMSPRVVSV